MKKVKVSRFNIENKKNHEIDYIKNISINGKKKIKN